MARQKGEAKTGGRLKGTPNKATGDARLAIATFVDNNATRLQSWLDQIADGDPEHDVKPNPVKAFELFQGVIEYHIPKLARTEVTGSLTINLASELAALNAKAAD